MLVKRDEDLESITTAIARLLDAAYRDAPSDSDREVWKDSAYEAARSFNRLVARLKEQG